MFGEAGGVSGDNGVFPKFGVMTSISSSSVVKGVEIIGRELDESGEGLRMVKGKISSWKMTFLLIKISCDFRS